MPDRDDAAQAARDGLVHHLVLDGIVRRGRAPGLAELARDAGLDGDQARASLERLHRGHGLVLHPGTHDVWAAHPFSLVPTAFWVEGATRGWWAPCIWCALGIVAATARDATIHTHLGGEAESIAIRAGARALEPTGLVAHFPVPVAQAWDNVHRFCGSTLVFRGQAEVDAWCARHAVARGDVAPLESVRDLALSWYGGHLARDWRKWSVDEARAIFERHGFTGATWALPAASGRF